MSKKIAIVYDWIDKWGGVERLLLTLHEMFPEADFYTSYYDKENTPWADKLNIHTSFIQKLPNFIRKSRVLSLPLYPYAFESFDLTTYDVVISVTSAFAKSVITKPNTKHICYLLTPPRYLWGAEDEYIKGGFKKFIAAGPLEKMRKFDFISAQRPDSIISLSQTVSRRCQKYYHRESEVIYPPFDISYWASLKPEKVELKESKYYLIVSRLEPYKKVDLVVKAFKNMKDKNLVVVGEGSQKEALKTISGNNTQFLGRVSDEKLAYLYGHAEAFIMPQEEDFGYTSLEAQFFGCPVITYAHGGGTETVLDGETGVHFPRQTEKSLIEGLDRFHTISYNVKSKLEKEKVKHLKKYSREKFQQQIKALI